MGRFNSVERLLEYLERIPEVKLDGKDAPVELQGKIEFRNVTFKYPTRKNKPVLKVLLWLRVFSIILFSFKAFLEDTQVLLSIVHSIIV